MKNPKVPKNAKEMKKMIQAYFSSHESNVLDKNGEIIFDEKGVALKKVTVPYTLTGLALALGLDSREALFEFQDCEMKTLIKKAVMKIEEYAEEKLFSKESFSGVKLFLSVNFERWQDRGDSGTYEEYEFSEDIKKWTV